MGKKKVGRPRTELTKAQYAEVETLAAVLSLEQIAAYFNIPSRTFADMKRRDDGISAAYDRGRAKAFKDVGSGLLTKALDGDNSSMQFYLKTQARWSETVRQEHALEGSKDGAMEKDEARHLARAILGLLGSAADGESDDGN